MTGSVTWEVYSPNIRLITDWATSLKTVTAMSDVRILSVVWDNGLGLYKGQIVYTYDAKAYLNRYADEVEGEGEGEGEDAEQTATEPDPSATPDPSGTPSPSPSTGTTEVSR